MIKVIIFDAVGLLTRQEPLSKALERDHGIPLEKTLPFFKGALQDCVAGQADLKEVLPTYLDAWGWDTGVDALLNFWFDSDHKIDQELVSYIKDLRKNGIICVLGTNNEKYRVAYMLDKMGFAELFDKAYSSAHIGHKKPDHRFFSTIFDDLENIKKEEILFWDDKLENVEGAKEFGIHAELYTTFENFEKVMKRYLPE
jgi:putative hydrolase of the HAD superfamily